MKKLAIAALLITTYLAAQAQNNEPLRKGFTIP